MKVRKHKRLVPGELVVSVLFDTTYNGVIIKAEPNGSYYWVARINDAGSQARMHRDEIIARGDAIDYMTGSRNRWIKGTRQEQYLFYAPIVHNDKVKSKFTFVTEYYNGQQSSEVSYAKDVRQAKLIKEKQEEFDFHICPNCHYPFNEKTVESELPIVMRNGCTWVCYDPADGIDRMFIGKTPYSFISSGKGKEPEYPGVGWVPIDTVHRFFSPSVIARLDVVHFYRGKLWRLEPDTNGEYARCLDDPTVLATKSMSDLRIATVGDLKNTI